MKLITSLLFLALAVPLSANPFGTFWGWLTGRYEPPCVINGAIAPRDWNFGPRCGKGDWNTPAILASDVTQAQVANVKDWAEFSKARMDAAFLPTPAVFVSFWSSRIEPVNPRELVSPEQSARAQVHLKAAIAALGMPCTMSLYDSTRGRLGGTIDYRGETRRITYAEVDAFPGTGSITLAGVIAMFASNPSDAAAKYLQADVRTICTAPANRPARRPISELPRLHRNGPWSGRYSPQDGAIGQPLTEEYHARPLSGSE